MSKPRKLSASEQEKKNEREQRELLRQQKRKEVPSDVEEYLKRGGSITTVEAGVSGVRASALPGCDKTIVPDLSDRVVTASFSGDGD